MNLQIPNVLPGLPMDLIRSAYAKSPGHESVDDASGKFASPASSAALVANGFGMFLERPETLPDLPGLVGSGPYSAVKLEAQMRFPWAGGLHPWLDVGLCSQTHLIGIESKRFEPYRPHKTAGFSPAYDRLVWGDGMDRITSLRKAMIAGVERFEVLDAVQLIKHAYGIATQSAKAGRAGTLLYLFAEPATWPNHLPLSEDIKAQHRAEIGRLANWVAGDRVGFRSLRWEDLLEHWTAIPTISEHAKAIRAKFSL